MPRQGRIIIEGELFHVTQRGNYRQQIFFTDQDKAYYLRLLEEYKNRYGLELFAFCLMDNHIHLIVRPKHKNSLAQTMCRCHQQYSSYMHKKNKIQGHLWQERFFSCLLLGNHIPCAIRYVERNPVRAGIVEYPWEYTWSSAKAHSGVVYKAITLSDFSDYIQSINWKEFISQSEKEDQIKQLRDRTAKGSIFGPEQGIEEIKIKINRRIPGIGRKR